MATQQFNQSAAPAIPKGIGLVLRTLAPGQTAPGHNFSLYYHHWNSQNWEKAKPANNNPGPPEGLRRCLDFSSVSNLAQALVYRRECAVQSSSPKNLLRINTVSTSPFVTGLGSEHPIENGFAFLTPYGIPYLAGSGVKGVLRYSARVLLTMGKLNADDLDILFGKETEDGDSDALCGALLFHDVIPTPPGNPAALTTTSLAPRLAVEIMNAHHSGYLMPKPGQEKTATPHETENPQPHFFLAVPAGWHFQFLVTANPARLNGNSLSRPWKELLADCFEKAFDWFGFGAKTAVGYGAFRSLSDKRSSDAGQRSSAPSGPSISNPGSAWVDAFMGKMPHTIQALDRPFHRILADAWAQIEDASLKTQARQYIRQKWSGDWDSPRGRRKEVRPLYGEDQ